jgi:hypothetical protein
LVRIVKKTTTAVTTNAAAVPSTKASTRRGRALLGSLSRVSAVAGSSCENSESVKDIFWIAPLQFRDRAAVLVKSYRVRYSGANPSEGLHVSRNLAELTH